MNAHMKSARAQRNEPISALPSQLAGGSSPLQLSSTMEGNTTVAAVRIQRDQSPITSLSRQRT